MISILNIALLLPLQAAATAPASLSREISGIVSHEGKPVRDAIVHFLRRRVPLSNGRLSLANSVVEKLAKTDQDGQFKLSLTAWRNYSAYAQKDGLISAVTDKITCMDPRLEFELSPMAAVKGSFVYRGQAPGRTIPIRLYRVSTEETAVPLIVSSLAKADGSFVVTDLPHARWQLMLGSAKRRLANMVVLETGKETRRIELQRAISLDCRLSTTGRADGLPIKGARVQLSDGLHFYETESNAAGMFELRGLARGPGATILVDASGYRLDLMALEPGLSPRDKSPQGQLAMRKGREIRGKIVGLDGKPLAGVAVLLFARFRRNGRPNHDLSVYLQSKADGSFRTTAADPNTAYELRLILADGEPQYHRHIFPGEGGPDFGVFRVGAQRARALVRIPQGMSRDLELRIYGSKESGRLLDYKIMLPQANGSYLSPTMPEGEYMIIARSKTLGLARGVVRLRQLGSPVSDVSMTMSKPRVISGKIVDATGQPRKGYRIQLLQSGSAPGGGSTTWTDVVMERIAEEAYPVKDYPRVATCDEKGAYTLTCYEASGQYDFVVTAPKGASGGNEVLMRITHVTGRALPLNIILH